MIDVELIRNSLPLLLRGATVSLKIAFFGCCIGFSFGTIIGLIQSGKNYIFNLITSLYIGIIRGTPMLIQIYFAFFVLPQFGINISPLWTAIVAIGLNSAAYISNVIRSGISSVDIGQIEAGKVLGLSTFQITRYIVLPQAIRVVLPALGNEFITLIKDSSLASMIGVAELTREGSFIRSRTLDALSIYSAVAIIYLIMTTTLSFVMTRIERRMNQNVGN